MEIEAATQLFQSETPITGYLFSEIKFLMALSLTEATSGVETQLILQAVANDGASGSFRFSLLAHQDNHWDKCCEGFVRIQAEKSLTEVDAGIELAQSTAQCGDQFQRATEECNVSLPPKDLYDILHRFGTDYGPSFQVLDDIHMSERGCALSSIKPRQWAVKCDEHQFSPHIIHPSTLDGPFQLIPPAVSACGRENLPALVPSQIERMWIGASGMSNPGTSDLHALVHSKLSGYRGTRSSITVTSSKDHDMRILIHNLEATFINSKISKAVTRTKERCLCWHLDWN